jgi:starvation-inducible DNA-binding protein
MSDLSKNQVQLIQPDLGLNEKATKKLIGTLQKLLADEMVLYMKLRNFHWNVTGAQFIALHELFETQYTELADVIDDLAERIRSYGVRAIGTLKEVLDHTRLDETPNALPSANEMVAELVADHETLVRLYREGIEEAGKHNSPGEEDLFTALLQDHQKKAWLLRAHIEG